MEPAGFKKRKKKEKTSRKPRAAASEDDDGDAAVVVKPTTGSGNAAAKLAAKKKKKKKKATSVLSFGEDEEIAGNVQEFKSKKSTLPRSFKLASSSGGGSSKASTQVSSAGMYSKEAMAALQKGTKRLPPSVAAASAAAAAKAEAQAQAAAEAMGTAVQGASFDGEGNAVLGGDTGENGYGDGSIPTTEAIRAARRKREMQRQQGDYIPLDDGDGDRDRDGDVSTTASHRSRLSRNHDDDDEATANDGNNGVPMSFGAAARRSTKQDARVRMQSALEQQDSVGEHAAVEQWEQELMRSGAATKKGQYVPRGRSKLPSSIGGGGGGSGSGSAAGNHNGGEMLAPEVAVEQLHRRLSGILTSLEEVHRSHSNQLVRVQDDLELSEKGIPALEDDLKSASGRYTFYQDMKFYTGSMLNCLDEKVPLIKDCEARVHVAWKNQADSLVQRQRQDYLDAAAAFASGNGSCGTAEGDGRMQRKRRRIEAKLHNRRGSSDSGGGAAAVAEKVDPATLTDDDLPDDERAQHVEQQAKAAAASKTIFNDLLDPAFCEPSQIAARFEEWKFGRGFSYKSAYVGMSLRKILVPLVQRQLLEWNPLDPKSSDFLEMEWVEQLSEYGLSDAVEVDEEDPDLQLVPDLVELAVLPKLCGICEHVWDPSSAKQSATLLELIKQLADDFSVTVAADRDQTKTLFSKVLTRLTRMVDDYASYPAVPSLTEVAEIPAGFVAGALAQERKVLESVLRWTGFVTDAPLQTLVLGFLSGRMLRTVRQLPSSPGALMHIEKIAKLMPPKWFLGEWDTAVRAKKAANPFVQYVLSFRRQMLALSLPEHVATDVRNRFSFILTTFGKTAK